MNRYDTKTKKWTFLLDMIEPRQNFQLIWANGLLYAIGGETEYGAINSVEYYDKSTNRWFKTTKMSTARSAAGSVLFKNHIYVLGGLTTKGYPLNVVERFDLYTKQWTKVCNN